MITDFGRSFLKGEDHKFRPPSQFIPPEVLFREQGGQGGDIWTTACTIYEVLGRRPLFVNGKKSPTHLILDMISAMGSPPRTWWERWRMRKKYLNEDGTCKISLPYAPLQSRFLLIGRGLDGPTCALGEVERSALELLLLEMLKYSPTERKTASEAVETLWMKIWGRKALEAYRC